MTQQSRRETIGVQKERADQREMENGREKKQEYIMRSQEISDRKSHKIGKGTQPTAICPDKDTNSSSAPRELFYHQPLTQQWWKLIQPHAGLSLGQTRIRWSRVLAPERCGPGLGKAATSLLHGEPRLERSSLTDARAAVEAVRGRGWMQAYSLCLHFVTGNLRQKK